MHCLVTMAMSTAVSLMRAVSGSSPYCLRLPIFDAGSSWPPRHASSPSPWPCDGNESRFLHCWRTSLVRIILMDDVHLKRNDGKTTVSCRAIGALPCRLDTCMEIKILRRDPSTRRLLDGAAVLIPRRSTEPGRPRHRREMKPSRRPSRHRRDACSMAC